jgi:hypothetical protein
MDEKNIFCYEGRPDGLGNRIDQLISIQKYCEINNCKCIYLWNNGGWRKYDIFVKFDDINIVKNFTEKNKKNICQENTVTNKKPFVKFNFTFSIPNINYDTIIHIRATDRIVEHLHSEDFSTKNELVTLINKTINYVNSEKSISTFTIVSDDISFKEYMKNKIHKKYVELSYNFDIHKDWLDFYYLTKPKNNVIMCSKFSSYSICASILGNKPLLIFKNSLKSESARMFDNADIKIID